MSDDFHHRQLPIFLRSMIVPGDNVIWWGQPDPKSFALYFDRSHMIEACFIFLSAFLTGSFAIIYSINPLIYIVFPIFLFGLFMILQPIFRYRRARKIFYIITERYLYILDGHLSPFVPRDIKNVQWVKTGVLGNVFFREATPVRHGIGMHDDGFIGVNRPEHVALLIGKFKNAAWSENNP